MHVIPPRKGDSNLEFAALLYLLVFAASGVCVSGLVFRGDRPVLRLWLGLVAGLVMLMWFPALFAFISGSFDIWAQLEALVLALILGADTMVVLDDEIFGKPHSRSEAKGMLRKLSGRTPDDLRSGARVVPGDEKEDPLDFALWKSAKPGEPYWESPWGKGRPGWHIECSAMSEKYIPLPLDIHGGGLDLIFPHHENEIAQTEAALGKPLANIWMHNGFVQVDSEKMSKSLGNFKTIRDILESYLAETLRYFLAGKHYRSPIDFSLDNMDESERSQKRVYECLREVDKALARENWKPGAAPAELVEELKQQDQSFMDALEDDVNTAAAMGHLFNMVRIAGRVLEDKKLRNSEGGRDILRAFRDATAKWDTLLGLFAQKPEGFLASLREIRARRRGLDMNKVAGLLRERQEARAAKDFARSDAARDELAALGVEVRDTPEGPVWDII